MATHNELGKEGEQAAVDYLIQNDYEILAVNWRYKKAEVDIIAAKDQFLVFVEVKTRSSLYFGSPEEFVNKKKITLLIQAANAYYSEFNCDNEIRFDIIALHKVKNDLKLEHIKDAFYHFS